MIAKIFPTGKGGIEYLQSKEFCPTLRGDPAMTQDLIEASGSKNPSTAGVLSFTEHITDLATKLEIAERYEREVLCPGIAQEDYSITWIEHQETAKDGGVRTGLHFVMSNTHLSSGKQMQPYWHKRDKPLKMAFQKVINAEYGFTDPDDPERKQATQIDPRAPKTVREYKQAFGDIISDLIKQGEVVDRKSVADALSALSGVEIARETDKSISLAVEGHKRNIRLTGAIYERDFTPDPTGDISTAKKSDRDIRREAKQLERLRESIQSRGRTRAREAERLYQSPQSSIAGDPPNPNRVDPHQPILAPQISRPVARVEPTKASPINLRRADQPDCEIDHHERNRPSPNPIIDRLIRRARRTAERIGAITQRITQVGLEAIRPRRHLEPAVAAVGPAVGRG